MRAAWPEPGAEARPRVTARGTPDPSPRLTSPTLDSAPESAPFAPGLAMPPVPAGACLSSHSLGLRLQGAPIPDPCSQPPPRCAGRRHLTGQKPLWQASLASSSPPLPRPPSLCLYLCPLLSVQPPLAPPVLPATLSFQNPLETNLLPPPPPAAPFPPAGPRPLPGSPQLFPAAHLCAHCSRTPPPSDLPSAGALDLGHSPT